MKHKKVIEQWYEISFGASHRTLGNKIDEFLKGSPDLDDELWQDNHTVLRDYEGDYDGILIYHTDDTSELIEFICKKLGVDYNEFKDINFKLIS